ncbi:CNEP1R1 family protein [Pleurotus pulmonarius]
MPPRSTPPPRSSTIQLNDPATYSDLLRFEERLKTNAANLQRRKHRYQLFLGQLLFLIAFLLCEVLLPPHISILVIPYKMLLQWLLPEIYTPDVEVTLHPAFASGLLFVSFTTLVLFFASGMYSDKIAYANKYVPHANRALRSFNMFLNVRKPPLRSKLRFNPIRFFFPRPETTYTTTTDSPASSPPPTPADPPVRSPSRSVSRTRSTALPIAPIPPSNNPRGELIFSSRVDKNFRESYERYRSAFERRKEKQRQLERSQKGWFGISWLRFNLPFTKDGGEVSDSGTVNGPDKAVPLVRTPTGTSTRSSKGGGSRSGTPPSTPKNHVSRQRDRSTSRPRAAGSRQSTPPVSPSPSRHGSTRGRREGTPGDGSLTNVDGPMDRERERDTTLTLRAFALEKSAPAGLLYYHIY